MTTDPTPWWEGMPLAEARRSAEYARPCKDCPTVLLFFVRSPQTGRVTPLCEDPQRPGLIHSHFLSCPTAVSFAERARAAKVRADAQVATARLPYRET